MSGWRLRAMRTAKRAFQPPQEGLSAVDAFELQLLAIGTLLLLPLAAVALVAFPLLAGFDPLYLLVTAMAMVGSGASYAVAMRGHGKASARLFLGVIVAGVWIVMLRNAGLAIAGVFILTNLLPIGLAFALHRFLVGIAIAGGAVAYVVVSVQAFGMAASDGLSVAIALVAGSVLAGLAPALRSKERRRADEAEARRTATQTDYRTLFENMAEGFAHCRVLFESGVPVDWEYLHVNRNFASLTGLAESVGKRVSQIIPGIRETNPGLFETYGRVARGGPPERFETEVPALHRWFSVSVYHAAPDEFIAVFDNITQRKEAEQRLRQAQESRREVERLDEVNKMRMEFLNAAAHDLKTPLTPMKLELATLRLKGGLDDGQRVSLERLDRGLKRFQNLIDDLLDAARLQAGRLALRRTRVRLAPLLTEAVDAFRTVAGQEDVELTLEEGPDARVDADPAKAVQVLMNLVSNAIKYTPAGGRVRMRSSIKGREAVVEFRDSGLGMTPEQIGRLFQAFVRLHETTPGVAKGTGLGLYISKGIVEAHGGRIWAESAGPGKGSAFFVAWPLAAADPNPKPQAAAGPRAPAVSQAQIQPVLSE